MAFASTIYQGAVGNYNVDELAETGLLTTKIGFSVDSDNRETKAHVSTTAIDQIVRTRTINRGLMIDLEGEIIPSAGLATGLGKVWAGMNIATCAHFSSSSTDHRLGYTRDSTKLLQVMTPTLDLDPESPASVKYQMKYFPQIAHDAASAA